jgi:uncharacterized protein (DUF934 family)
LRVIKDNQVIDDGWVRIATVEPGQAVPEGDLILPYRYWKANREVLAGRTGKTAVCLDGDDRVQDIAGDLDRFELIALEFPKFRDGRCYSHARLLRDRYHYKGDIRAVGDVLRDQLFFMKRCGISSFYLRDDKDINAALAAFQDFTVKYQTAADGALPVYKLR